MVYDVWVTRNAVGHAILVGARGPCPPVDVEPPFESIGAWHARLEPSMFDKLPAPTAAAAAQSEAAADSTPQKVAEQLQFPSAQRRVWAAPQQSFYGRLMSPPGEQIASPFKGGGAAPPVLWGDLSAQPLNDDAPPTDPAPKALPPSPPQDARRQHRLDFLRRHRPRSHRRCLAHATLVHCQRPRGKQT